MAETIYANVNILGQVCTFAYRKTAIKVDVTTLVAVFLVKVASGNLRQLFEQSELQMSYAEALTKT